jgi:hypothetical protein
MVHRTEIRYKHDQGPGLSSPGRLFIRINSSFHLLVDPWCSISKDGDAPPDRLSTQEPLAHPRAPADGGLWGTQKFQLMVVGGGRERNWGGTWCPP